MPRRLLDDRFIRSVAPPTDKVREEYFDDKIQGLSIRISRKGRKTWHFKTKVKGGARPGHTLGTYPDLSLKEARAAALEIASLAKRGINVREEESAKKAKAIAEAAEARSVRQVLDQYFSTHIDQNLKSASAKERKTQLLSSLAPFLDVRMDQLTQGSLQRIIDVKQAEGKIPMANRLCAAIRAFTKWAARREFTNTDVGSHLQKAGRETPRERTPTIEEIREIWAATYDMGNLWGPFFRMCLLTAQRSRSDILEMRWSWVDLQKARYEVPDPKNRKPHIVPLSVQAMNVLTAHRDSLQGETDGASSKRHTPLLGEFVFTTTGRSASQGVSRAKSRLDDVLARKRLVCGNDEPFEHWVLHDIRRSFATAMVESGVSESVTDLILNHVAVGSRPSAVSAVYMKSDRLSERARAMQDWADLVTAGCARGSTDESPEW